jgi:hypothetical protein
MESSQFSLAILTFLPSGDRKEFVRQFQIEKDRPKKENLYKR